MTLEAALLAAVAALFGLLLKDHVESKRDLKYVRKKLERLERAYGRLSGRLKSYRNCPSETCPFRGNDEEEEDPDISKPR